MPKMSNFLHQRWLLFFKIVIILTILVVGTLLLDYLITLQNKPL